MTPLCAQEVTTKIVGGKDASPNQYPWMVGLLHSYRSDNFYAQFCGGVLIHPYYVLTAAHCLEDESSVSVEILVGTDDLDVGGRRLEIAQIIMHPQYNDVTLDYDIALLRLSSPVTDIKPISIADEENWQLAGTVGKILGWGQLSNDGGFPNKLQEGDVSILPFAPANQAWSYTLTPRMAPASGPDGSPDTCGGDSGGPLLVRRPLDDEWVVAGITSYGAGCGDDDPPAIYTRVFELRRYIYGIIYPNMTSYLNRHNQYALLSDADGDSMPLFEEYGFNTDPDVGNLTALPRAGEIDMSGQTYATMTFQKQRVMRSFEFRLEQSATPSGPWESIPLSAVTVSRTFVNSTTEFLTVRATQPIEDRPFIRLNLETTGDL